MLEQLFQQAARDSASRELVVPRSKLESLISQSAPALDVYSALSKSAQIKLIAEIKRASPSKGDLAQILNPAGLALGYQESGADAISVLTERTGFKGSLEDLKLVSAATTIPVLRKDFISNEYQVLEARANGASFILLILAQLDEAEARSLMALSHSLGMGVLVETHTRKEIEVANNLGAKLVGINTRDLKTFRTDLGLFESLANLLDTDCIKVAESSVRNIEDVRTYRNAGADVVLVGEALVTGDWRNLIPQIVSVS